MADVFLKEERSRIMSIIRGKNTGPEITVRKALFALGYRFRIHISSLPGKPDIVLPGRRKIIFVHGCFWHGHKCRAGQNQPKSNRVYWREKLARNKARDKKNQSKLRALGWEVMILWECQIRDANALSDKLGTFLERNAK